MTAKFLGAVILFASLVGVFHFETVSDAQGAFRVFHWPAMVLTGVGPFGLVLLCSDFNGISMAWQILIRKSASKIAKRQEREADLLQSLSQAYYTQGAKALDSVDGSSLSPYVRKALDRLAIRMPIPDVRGFVVRDRDRVETEIRDSVDIVALGVRLAPSIGMLGTILGMVKLLASLKDPSHIGSHMSLALLTTFYGLLFSLVFWTPLHQKLERINAVELRGFDQVLHWLELLEKRKPATYFADAMDADYEVDSRGKAPSREGTA